MKAKVTNTVSIVVVVGLALCVAFEHQKKIALAREHQPLEQQLAHMARLMAENEQLVFSQAKSSPSMTEDESRELLRLRGEVGLLRQQSGAFEAAREENRQARTYLDNVLTNAAAPKALRTVDDWPQDSWTFKGYGSADATLESSLWAANNGDVKALLASATGQLQKVIEDDLKNKSDTEASIRAMDEVMGIKSIHVVNREVQSPDTMVLTVEMEQRTDSRTEKLVVQKIGNEWKLAGPAK